MRRAASVFSVERTRRRASTRLWPIRSMIWRGRLPMTCGARPWLMCWTSFQTRRRGTTIVIGICTGGGAYMSVPRLHWSGRRCAWPLPLGEAGSLSGRRRLPNCCSVLDFLARPSCSSTDVPGLRNPQAPEHERRLCYPSVVAIRPWRRILGLWVHWGQCPSVPRREGISAALPGPNPAGRYRRGE